MTTEDGPPCQIWRSDSSTSGTPDFSWSESVVEDALARIPGSRAVTLARAGHVPFFDDPDGFQKATGAFLRELVAAGQTTPSA